MAHLKTLASPSVTSLVVKRSRFVTYAAPVASAEEALAYFGQVQDLRASHNCWAYRLDARTFRYSDDGEPGGSAGPPIYNAIERGNFVNVAVIVTRYFGGIKLGVGGLARAYGGAATECLTQAPTIPYIRTVHARIRVKFDGVAGAFRAAERYARVDAEYSPTGCVITVQVPEELREQLESDVCDWTKGKGVIEYEEK